MPRDTYDDYLDRYDPANSAAAASVYDREDRINDAALELVELYSAHADELFAVLADDDQQKAGRIYGRLYAGTATNGDQVALDVLICAAADIEAPKQVDAEIQRVAA